MKRSFKLICAAFILFLGSSMSLAADPMDYKNAIGMYGMISTDACGLQYQNWITHNFGIQVEGYASYSDSYWTSNGEYQFSIATQALFNLFENPINERTAINFYAWLLGEYKGYNEYVYVNGENEGTAGHYDDLGYFSKGSIGAGFGFEFIVLKHLSIPLEFGYAGTVGKKPYMGFVVGTGLRYRF